MNVYCVGQPTAMMLKKIQKLPVPTDIKFGWVILYILLIYYVYDYIISSGKGTAVLKSSAKV